MVTRTGPDFDAVAEAISPGQLASAIGARKMSGSASSFRCPLAEAHSNGDKSPSLSIFRDGNRTAAKCHGCGLAGSPVTVAAQVWGVELPEAARRLADEIGLYVPDPKGDRRSPPGLTLEQFASEKRLDLDFLRELGLRTRSDGRAAVEIPYRDADGEELRVRLRWALSAGDGSTWAPGEGLHLYGLDRLAEAPKGKSVIVVEGETDCLACWTHGAVAVGCPGATAWRPEWARHLEGRRVYIWREPDDAGTRFARSVASDIPDARVIPAPDGLKDLHDLHMEVEGDTDAFRQRFRELARGAVPAADVLAEPELDPRSRAEVGDVAEQLPQAIPAAEALDDSPLSFLVDGFILRDETGAFVADGGAFKTTLMLATAAAVAAGEPLFGRFEVEDSGPVLIVSEEDGGGVLRNRLAAIAKGHGWDVDTVLRRVHLLALRGATLDEDEWRDHLAAEIERLGAILTAFDPYSRLTLAKENSTDENKANISFWSRLNRMGVTVLAVHHAGKLGEGKRKLDRVRGASAINQACRFIYFLERGELGIAVECLKLSRAELPESFVVEPKIETEPSEPTVWKSARFEYVTQDKAAEDAADRFVKDMLRRYPGTNSTGLKDLAKGTGINAVEVSAAIRRLSTVKIIEYEDGPRGAKEWHLTDRADPAEKSPATSARYPADPADRLPGRVREEPSPCPSIDIEGRDGRGAGESRQGGESDPDSDLDAALGSAP